MILVYSFNPSISSSSASFPSPSPSPSPSSPSTPINNKNIKSIDYNNEDKYLLSQYNGISSKNSIMPNAPMVHHDRYYYSRRYLNQDQPSSNSLSSSPIVDIIHPFSSPNLYPSPCSSFSYTSDWDQIDNIYSNLFTSTSTTSNTIHLPTTTSSTISSSNTIHLPSSSSSYILNSNIHRLNTINTKSYHHSYDIN